MKGGRTNEGTTAVRVPAPAAVAGMVTAARDSAGTAGQQLTVLTAAATVKAPIEQEPQAAARRQLECTPANTYAHPTVCAC
jgi:hypothetical protein